MGDKAKGLYNKFRVERTDGSSQEGGKHFNCGYFVLDMDNGVACRDDRVCLRDLGTANSVIISGLRRAIRER